MGKTLFIACAALGREVRAIIRRYGWDADFEAVDAKLHVHPAKIGPAVEERLKQSAGRYDRRVVVYGHCGAFDLDAILAKYDAVRPSGPHCYEMYGGGDFARTMRDEPGSYFLTDFLICAWDSLVVKGLKLDQYPELKAVFFAHYRQVVYYCQEEDPGLTERAREIAAWLNLPLIVKAAGYGDLERRLVAIMEGRPQPVTEMTQEGYSIMAYPTANTPPYPEGG